MTEIKSEREESTAESCDDNSTHDETGMASDVRKKKKTRSKAGCFTCRLKRMKCDELHPICGRCKRNLLTCIWPKEGNGKLTKKMRQAMRDNVDPYAEMNPKKVHLLVEVKENGKFRLTDPNPSSFSSAKNFKIKNTHPSSRKPQVRLKNDEQREPLDSSSMGTEFVNYSYDGNGRDFVKLESDSSNSPAGQESLNECRKSPSPVKILPRDEASSAETTTELILKAPIDAGQYNVLGADPDFFWGKMFDMNFTKPLMTPNFNIISPIPSLDGFSTVETPAGPKKSLLLSQFGADNNCYVLDNEQTGEIYLNLLQSFNDWSKTNDDDELLSVAHILSKYQFNGEELLLYFTCVHYFFPAIGPQPTLPQLTTTETFLPLIKQHPVVKDVFLCCGATFLEWCQPNQYTEVAESLYQKSRNKLKSMANDKTIKGDETWAFACFQLLCLTDKFRKGSGTSMSDRCVDNLAHSFNIIKKKIKLIKTQGSTTTDRMLIESFMYNYTVSLLVARDLSKLPSPFSKNFNELTKLLKSPLFDGCDVNWINNPILGSSVEAFEMLAKVSYLSRLHLPLRENEWIERGKRLLEECLYYTPPSLPDDVKNDPQKYETYRPSLLCGSIISKACYLLLSKILRFNEFQLEDFEIQGVVKYTIKSLCNVEKGSPLLCILLWSLLIIGAFTIDEEDRMVIKEYLRSASETIHSYGALKIADFLDLIWQQKNIDLLFVRENLSQVVI
ncbi:unnamed protein product [Kluyveromyces dobzhanskii CBS 2104]|uniref:WGS project CCBQ000000000 data, contig 00043 n=1 Tax=Kluyveromyces dobzhanskii CBS 2104 TaxID=1427455 RepID=A0A0A8L2N6_9SACH|nr:unnamed protein product [Kluyveromyces dobzhanskii CBS 2104]